MSVAELAPLTFLDEPVQPTRSDVLSQPTLSDEPVQPMSVAELAPLTFLDEPVQPTRLRCSITTYSLR